MKKFFYRALVVMLGLGMLTPSWLYGATKASASEGDTTAPTIVSESFRYSKNGSAYTTMGTASGGGYALGIDGSSTYKIDFGAATSSSEPLKSQYSPLYLNPSLLNVDDLVSYYNAYSDGEWRTYLVEAANGTKPFAFIKAVGTGLSLIDGAKHSIHPFIDDQMTVPGNYVPGIYQVNGSISDISNNVSNVSYKLVIDNSAPAVQVIAPTAAEKVSGGQVYQVKWTANDEQTGIKSNSVKIQYRDGSWKTIAQNQPNTGSYDWNVGPLNANDFKVRVMVENNAGIAGRDASAEFQIGDFSGPVITLIGDAEVTIEKGSAYIDQGATAVDNYEGNVSSTIVVDKSAVNESEVGTYFVKYNVVDAAGKAATEVVRTVKVIDSSVLAAPANVSAVAGNGEVSVTWNVVAGATAYRISYKKTSDGIYGNPVPVSGTTTKVTGLLNGISYDFKIEAIGSNGAVGFATVLASTPAAPRITTAVAVVTPAVVSQPATPEIVQTPEETTPPTEQGEIKGTEIEEEEAEDINWTPWIILFILIILAGAATGGYFYWFGKDDEEEIVSSEVIEKSKPSKKDEAKSPKKATASKKNRW